MGPDVRSNYYANREQLPVACVFFNIQVGKAIKRRGLQEEGGHRRSPIHVTDRRMECGTRVGKPEGGKRKDRRIHREQDKADRSRHDNKHRAKGERVEYKRGNGRRAHKHARRVC